VISHYHYQIMIRGAGHFIRFVPTFSGRFVHIEWSI